MPGLQASRGRVTSQAPGSAAAPEVARRLDGVDWAEVERGLATYGHAVTPGLLSAENCATLAALYADDRWFRSRVDMARHRFGEGEYKYFAAPLPALVAALRTSLYPRLAPIANRWAEVLGERQRYADTLDRFLAGCRQHGQTKPTPLLLRYLSGGYNCLHQDVYGPLVFPLQVTVLLSRPGIDFTGGEFLLVEQRPRAQSRADVVPLQQGDGVIFTTRHRPAAGARGHYRAAVRHGVSRLRSGERLTLGVIFHDAA
jgi:uncharacterized protein